MNEQKNYDITEQLSKLTLSQIVTRNYKTAEIFEKYNLDFCCRGNKLLAMACEEKGIEENEVISDLNKLLSCRDESNGRYNEWSTDFLTDYIINNHHTYIRNIIPVLTLHTQKVASAHGERHPETTEIARIFSAVSKDLKHHLMKEEGILFPYIKYMSKALTGESKTEKPYFNTVASPIKMMEAEHAAAGDELYEIRNLSGNYTPPEDACNTYKVCYSELKEFEEDLHKHVHLENNILFPKAVLLEKELMSR
jgi:regulator of cell morphogenesis and NO signaling